MADSPPPLTCPKCGGALGAPAEGKITCEYCGATMDVDASGEAKPVDAKEGLYERGREALARGDYAAAYEDYDRITDEYPDEYEAWLEKGIAGAFRELREDGRVGADETLLRVEKALEVYRGDRREEFEREAADRVGEAALELYDEAVQRGAATEANAKGLLDLLFFWETSGSDETAAWDGIVRLAEQTATPEGTRPFAAVAEKYRKIIRAKAEAEAKAAAESKKAAEAPAAAAAPEEAVAAPKSKSGRTAAIIITIVVVVVILLFTCCAFFYIIGSTT
jgi:uncharacterized Zn finger protein (UPF0148 family)